MKWMWVYVGLGCLATALAKPTEKKEDINLLMPNVQPQTPDEYLCQAFKMPEDPIYVTGFQPHANMSTAHHMLLYGCEEPGDEQQPWTCGEMEDAEAEKQYPKGPICKFGTQIIYAWAMDAPKLDLPKDVAFKVGGNSGVSWIVLQVHYKDVSNFIPPVNGHDDSGITLQTTNNPQPKRAGVYLLGTGGELSPQSTVYMETACEISEPIEMHPFAYRTHAHIHGQVNSGYRVRDGEWKEIGRESPKKPQMFYDTTNPGMVVKEGDILAARCTMINNETETIHVGPTGKDEMCNFYIMYYVNGDELLENSSCFSQGPPSFSWADFEVLHPENIPEDASLVPGESEPLKETQGHTDDLVSADIDEQLRDWIDALEEEEENRVLYGDELYPREEYYYPEELLEMERREYPEELLEMERREYPVEAYQLLHEVPGNYDEY